jgi:hypothetical protein
MYRAYHSTLLELRLNQNISDVESVVKMLAERGLSVLSVTAWQDDGELVLRLVLDDMLRAGDILREAFFTLRERDVVLVEAPQRPGALKHVASILARHEIGIRFLCSSASVNQTATTVVLETTDNQRARLLLDSSKLETPPVYATTERAEAV